MEHSGKRINETKTELVKNNYTPIEVGGYALFECSRTRPISTKFTALSPNKKDTITGCLCESGFGHSQLIILQNEKDIIHLNNWSFTFTGSYH